jgi:hypothetical protein
MVLGLCFLFLFFFLCHTMTTSYDGMAAYMWGSRASSHLQSLHWRIEGGAFVSSKGESDLSVFCGAFTWF